MLNFSYNYKKDTSVLLRKKITETESFQLQLNHSVYVLLHIQVNYMNHHPLKAAVSRKPFLCCRIILYHQYAGQACTVQIVCLHQLGSSTLLEVLPVKNQAEEYSFGKQC